MNRDAFLQRLRDRREPWDLAVVGGGATGVGIAVDAAARGYQVVLLEQSDFGKGTSSRSTKLVHGGVRYLKQGNVSLVLEALLLTCVGLVVGMVMGHGLVELVGHLVPRADAVGLTGRTLARGEVWLIPAALALGLLATVIPAVRAYRSDLVGTLSRG